MHQNQSHLLRKRRFLPLFVTQFLQAFNDNFFKTALLTLIAYQSALSLTKMQITENLAAGLFILPFFLFSATAGQIADKYEKGFLIRIIKFVEVLFACIASFFFIRGDFMSLMLILFLLGTHSTFFGPLKYSILPDHLREDELIGGNALVEASTFLAILLGTICGGLLITGHFGAYIVSGLMILVAVGGWISSFFIPLAEPASSDLKINHNFMRETWHLVKQTKKNHDVYIAILGISWFWAIGGTFLTQFPTFAKDVLGGDATVLTLFLAMFSIGIAAGSLLCNRLLQGEITSKFVPLGVFGLSLFVFDLHATSYQYTTHHTGALISWYTFLHSWTNIHILVDILLLAVCGGIFVVPLYAIMQSRAEPKFRSRTIACGNIISALFMVAAAVVVMVLYKIGLTVTQIFFIAGVANTVAAIYICKLLPEALIKSFIHWLLKAVYKVDVKGMENYKAAGDKVIIIANHTSYLDIVLLSAFLPDKFTIAVNTYVARKWWIRPLLALSDTFPVDPTNPMATKSIIKVIKAGKKCVIFPEGRLTVTGSLMKIYEGPGLIADKSGATIVPVRIDGAMYTPFSRMRGKVRLRWFPKITLTIMPGQLFSTTRELRGRARRRYMGTKLYKIMTDVTFESSNYQQTLFDAILDARIIHTGSFKIAEDADRKPLSYNQMIARSFILGKQIAKATKQGDNVGVMLPTSNAAMVTFFALQAYGRIPAMLNFSAGFQLILSACQTATVKIIYTSRRFVKMAKLDEIVEKLESAGLQIVFLEDFRKTISKFDKLRGLLAGYFAKYEYARNCPLVKPSDPAVVLFTSGSEGKPKAVLLSHSNLLANSYQMQARVDFTSQDLIFNALPIFHCFGLTAGMILPTVSGIRAFFYPSPLHYRIVPELIYDTSATMMFGTDTFLNGYARYAHTYDFYSIRYVFAGAEKLKESTRKMYGDKFGVRVFEGYGATETAPVISTNTPMLNKPGTVGCLLPSMESRIEPVPGIKSGGRLIVKGPNVMLGYIRAEQPGVVEHTPDEWYDTGDIVDIDTDGYIRIKGRAKRFAKIGGEMVSLTMIETYLAQLWPGSHHGVVSIPDIKKGEQIVLVTDKEDATREEIIRHVKENGLSELSIPKKILHTTQLPILASGKLDYPSLQKIVEPVTKK